MYQDFCIESHVFPAVIRLGQWELGRLSHSQCGAAAAEVPGAQCLFQEHNVLLIPQLNAMGF